MENKQEPPTDTPRNTILFEIKKISKNKVFLADAAIALFLIWALALFLAVSQYTVKSSTLVSPVQTIKESVLNERVEARDNYLADADNEYRQVIGFLPSWTAAKSASIDFDKLTQIIYFGFGVNDNGEIIQYNQEGKSTLEWVYFTSDYFINARGKAKENNVKVLVAFKMFDNETIDNLISNSVSADFFIRNAISILNKYDLDGINIDFEYFTDSSFPTSRYLNVFLQKLKDAIKKNNPEHLLSVDVNATVIVSDKAYDMVKIGEAVDEIIVMGYDYRNANSSRAGPTAPLYGEVNEHSIDESVKSLIGRVPLEKVILAVPFYGYEWETINNKHKSTTVAGSGALATYKRVQDLLSAKQDITVNWDENAMSPWFVYSQSGAIKQIYYEDERSIRAKMDYIKDNNLGGVAVWAIEYEGKYKELWETVYWKLDDKE